MRKYIEIRISAVGGGSHPLVLEFTSRTGPDRVRLLDPRVPVILATYPSMPTLKCHREGEEEDEGSLYVGSPTVDVHY